MTKNRIAPVDLFFVGAAAFALAFWQAAGSVTPPFDAYPKLISVALLVLSITCLIQQRLVERKEPPESVRKKSNFGRILFLLGIGLYICCIAVVGYFVSTFLYLVAALQIGKIRDSSQFLETKSLLRDSLFSIALTGSIALFFKIALDLVFPSAWLF